MTLVVIVYLVSAVSSPHVTLGSCPKADTYHKMGVVVLIVIHWHCLTNVEMW